MKNRKNEAGLAHAFVILFLVVGVIGAAGFFLYSQQNKSAEQGSTTAILGPNGLLPAEIKTQADLDATDEVVAATGKQLDSDLDTSGLDSAVKELL